MESLKVSFLFIFIQNPLFLNLSRGLCLALGIARGLGFLHFHPLLSVAPGAGAGAGAGATTEFTSSPSGSSTFDLDGILIVRLIYSPGSISVHELLGRISPSTLPYNLRQCVPRSINIIVFYQYYYFTFLTCNKTIIYTRERERELDTGDINVGFSFLAWLF